MKSVTHRIIVTAPASLVYDLVADATRWPVLFEPTVHVEILQRDDAGERFAIWATGGDQVANWTSRRSFDPRGLRISFKQDNSMPPIGSMAGSWEFRDLGPAGTEVLLHHSFTTVDGSGSSAAEVMAILDRNSAAELAGLRKVAELNPPVFDFEETIEVDGSAADAYAFIYEAAAWPQRLPHVLDLNVAEEQPGIQRMTMVTRAPDGNCHETASIRLCTSSSRIVYKQVRPPALLLGHCGAWYFHDRPGGCAITARHVVMVDPRQAVGEPLSALRQRITTALGANSRVTIEHSGRFAARAAGGE